MSSKGITDRLADTPWRHHAVSAPITVTLALYFAGCGLHLLASDMHWLVGVLVTAIAVVATGFPLAARVAPLPVLAYVLACTTAGGLWLTAVTVAGALNAIAITALIVLALPAGIAYPFIRHVIARDNLEYLATLAKQDSLADPAPKDSLEQVFHAAGARGLTRLETETSRAGMRVVFRLSPKGSTLAQLRHWAPKIEAGLAEHFRDDPDVKIRRGALTFEEGDEADELIVHINTRDVLAETIPMPRESGPGTVTEPIGLGWYLDGRIIELVFIYMHALICGMNDAGKSNVLNVLLYHFTRSIDVTVWLSATEKSTPLVQPWLRPWLHAKNGSRRPVLDWVGTDITEGVRMLLAGYKLIDHRSRRPRGGAAKLTPSNDIPLTLIIIEEAATLLNCKTRFKAHTGEMLTPGQLALKVTQLGRSELVALILIAQRGTNHMLGPYGQVIKSQMRLTIALQAHKKGESQHVFPGEPHINLASLVEKGSMYVKLGRLPTVPGKAYFLGDDGNEISRIADEHSEYTVALETDAELALGPDYTQRWTHERVGHWLDPIRADERVMHKNEQVPVPTAGPIPESEPEREPERPRSHSFGGPPKIPDGVRKKIDQERSIRAGGAEIIEGLERMLRDSGAEPAATGGDKAEVDPRAQVGELLFRAGPEGMTPREILDKLDDKPARQTLQKWLSESVESGAIKKAQFGRYVHPDHHKE